MSNTQSHLIVTEEGIKIYNDDPASAILVEDQVEALSLIQKFYYVDHVKIGSIYPVPGIEFDPVEKKCDAFVCEINSKCCYRKMLDKSTGEPLTGCLTKTVARLIEHTAEKEPYKAKSPIWDTIPKESWKKFEQHYKGESPEIDKEEELWDELQEKVSSNQWFAGDLYHYMRKHYSITRKS